VFVHARSASTLTRLAMADVDGKSLTDAIGSGVGLAEGRMRIRPEQPAPSYVPAYHPSTMPTCDVEVAGVAGWPSGQSATDLRAPRAALARLRNLCGECSVMNVLKGGPRPRCQSARIYGHGGGGPSSELAVGERPDDKCVCEGASSICHNGGLPRQSWAKAWRDAEST